MKKLFITGLTVGALLFGGNALASTNTYTVKTGDTLWKIAQSTKTGVSELIKANPQLKDPNKIQVGQKINVPVKASASQVTDVVKLVNAERSKAGLKPLTQNWELSRVAQYKAEDMAKNHYFDHNSPTYGTPFQMITKFGIKYSSAGENIAQGQQTPQEVMKAWMNSSGHRANILNSSYTQIGVGYDANTKTWVQQFIRP